MKRGQVHFSRSGMALLEVVMGLTLFFITAVFVLDGLNSSMRGVAEVRLSADAADLACTVLAEVQIGLLEIKNEGPVAFDEKVYPGWSWQIIVTEPEDLADFPDLKRVEVVVRNDPERYTHRLIEFVQDDAAEKTGTASGELGGGGK